jgi:transposase-like protein
LKEDKASWLAFLQGLKERSLSGVQLFIGDKCLGLLEAINEVFPDAKYQRCTVHFYRNVFTVTPRSKVKEVAAMLKAIHAQENKATARQKAQNRVVGTFPDVNSALILVCARLRYVASKAWGTKRYMSMKHLEDIDLDDSLMTVG